MVYLTYHFSNQLSDLYLDIHSKYCQQIQNTYEVLPMHRITHILDTKLLNTLLGSLNISKKCECANLCDGVIYFHPQV